MKKHPILFLVAAALLVSCGDSATEPRLPGSLAIVDGDGVSSVVGSEQAVRVRVLDTEGRPLPEATVSWSVESGGGAVTPAFVVSDAAGEARATWTLGIRPGSQTLRASSGGYAVTLAQTARTGPPAILASSAPAPDASVVGSVVDPAPAVLVTDAYSNPVGDVVVTFTITAGEGSVTGETQVTGADGVAVAPAWTLGEAPGTNRLTATAAGTDPVTFEVEARVGGAEALAVYAGADQTAVVATAVTVPPAVRVTDPSGL
jgi:hypothetical protein